jgi:hypothetical protein
VRANRAGRYEVMSYAIPCVAGATEPDNRITVVTALARMERVSNIGWRFSHGILIDAAGWDKDFK